jgi:hypothetical protein
MQEKSHLLDENNSASNFMDFLSSHATGNKMKRTITGKCVAKLVNLIDIHYS